MNHQSFVQTMAWLVTLLHNRSTSFSIYKADRLTPMKRIYKNTAEEERTLTLTGREGQILRFDQSEVTDLLFSEDCILAHTPNICFTQHKNTSKFLNRKYLEAYVTKKNTQDECLFIQIERSSYLFRKELIEEELVLVNSQSIVVLSKSITFDSRRHAHKVLSNGVALIGAGKVFLKSAPSLSDRNNKGKEVQPRYKKLMTGVLLLMALSFIWSIITIFLH